MADSKNEKLQIHYENVRPILTVKDMNASRAFYIDILGFNEVEWGNDDFTSIGFGKGGIFLCKDGQGNPGTWIWIGFNGDIFTFYNQLKEKGVTILQPPTNYSWALEMHVADPDGHIIRFGTEPDYNKPFIDKQS